MKKLLLACQILIVCFCIAVWSLLGYGYWMRHQNRKKPCVAYHPGMTLEPGQCMAMELKSVPR